MLHVGGLKKFPRPENGLKLDNFSLKATLTCTGTPEGTLLNGAAKGVTKGALKGSSNISVEGCPSKEAELLLLLRTAW